jgi:hypothetical protein
MKLHGSSPLVNVYLGISGCEHQIQNKRIRIIKYKTQELIPRDIPSTSKKSEKKSNEIRQQK